MFARTLVNKARALSLCLLEPANREDMSLELPDAWEGHPREKAAER